MLLVLLPGGCVSKIVRVSANARCCGRALVIPDGRGVVVSSDRCDVMNCLFQWLLLLEYLMIIPLLLFAAAFANAPAQASFTEHPDVRWRRDRPSIWGEHMQQATFNADINKTTKIPSLENSSNTRRRSPPPSLPP
jgi:hypothetical protein